MPEPRRPPLGRDRLRTSYVVLICLAWVLVLYLGVATSAWLMFTYFLDLSFEGAPTETWRAPFTVAMNSVLTVALAGTATSYAVGTGRSLGMWAPTATSGALTIFWLTRLM